jgi:hypothetical protein
VTSDRTLIQNRTLHTEPDDDSDSFPSKDSVKEQRNNQWIWPVTVCMVCCLSLLPIINILYLITTFGVDVPYFDDWVFVSTLKKYFDHTLSVNDFFAQHNVHRTLVPTAIRMALFLLLGNWNLVQEMYISFLFVIFTYLILVWQAVKSHRLVEAAPSMWSILLISLFLFSAPQYETFIWASAASVFFSLNFFIVACIILLVDCYGSWYKFGIAASSAVCATFCLGSGIFLWTVCAVYFLAEPTLLRQTSPNLWKRFRIWTILSGVILFIYFYGYHVLSQRSPDLFYSFHHPMLSVRFFFGFIGNPIGMENLGLAVSTGVAGVAILFVNLVFSARLIREDERFFYACAPWALIALFVILCSFMGVVTMVRYGEFVHITSRYRTTAVLFWASLCVLTSLVVRGHVRPKFQSKFAESGDLVLTSFFCLLCMLILASSWQILPRYVAHNKSLIEGRDALLYRNDDRKIMQIFPHPTWALIVLEKLPVLAEKKLSFFRNVMHDQGYIKVDADDRLLGHIETWGNDLHGDCLRSEGCLEIGGWVVDLRLKKPAKKVFVYRGDEIMAVASVYNSRPDVAKHFSEKNYEFSGFSVKLSGKRLGSGSHRISFYALGRDEVTLVKLGEKTINVSSEESLLYGPTNGGCGRP